MVLGGLAGVPRELSLGVAVDRYRPDSEPLEQEGRGLHRCAVGAVDACGETGGADGFRVHLGYYGGHILLGGVRHVRHGPHIFPIHRGRAFAVGLLDRILFRFGAFGPVPGDAFDPVELGRVVGGRDHHASGHIIVRLDVELQRRRRDHAQVQDVRSRGHQPCAQRVLEHRRRHARVRGDGYPPAEDGRCRAPHPNRQLAAEVSVRYPAHSVGAEHAHDGPPRIRCF